MLLALPGVTLYRVNTAFSRGMSVMHHDIFSRGLTESFGTAAALLVAFVFGARELAPEFAASPGRLPLDGRLPSRATLVHPKEPVSPSPNDDLFPGCSAIPRRSRSTTSSTSASCASTLSCSALRRPGTRGHAGHARRLRGGRRGGRRARKVNQAFTPIFTPVVAAIGAGQIRGAEAASGILPAGCWRCCFPVVVLSLAGGAIMSIYGPTFIGGAWAAVFGACALNAFRGSGDDSDGRAAEDQPDELDHRVRCRRRIESAAIPAYGVWGAALGLLCPYLVKGILRRVEIWWFLEWRWPWRALVKPWIAALIPLPFALIVRFASYAWWYDLAAAVLYIAGYFITWRVIGLDPNVALFLISFSKRKARIQASDKVKRVDRADGCRR